MSDAFALLLTCLALALCHSAFSYGDYVVKCLLGSIDPTFDKVDERGPAACCNLQ
jgi:hypothetical protein